jgi:hypothetical protein
MKSLKVSLLLWFVCLSLTSCQRIGTCTWGNEEIAEAQVLNAENLSPLGKQLKDNEYPSPLNVTRFEA